MDDPILAGFLREQRQQAQQLADQSDLLEVMALEDDRYIAQFRCKGLVRRGGEIVEATDFHVGIWFPADYLHEVNPFVTLSWLSPLNIWHPNIRPPLICVGKIARGTELTELLYQLFGIITYHNWAPHDGLNPEARQWARNHQARFPTDTRPLKRRALSLQVTEQREAT